MVGDERSQPYDVRGTSALLRLLAARFRACPRQVQVAALLVGSFFAPSAAFACAELPPGTSMWVRLSQPVSSYSAKPGDPVHGLILESPECDGAALFPLNIPVEGRVISARRVGLGLVRETASLEIEFSRIVPPQGPPIEIIGRIDEVNNARESIKNGVILGTRSSETPQGQISSRLKYLPSFHLYPDPFLLGFKLLFPIFPEPEIYLPPATDLRVGFKTQVALPADLPPPPPPLALVQDEDLQKIAEALGQLPVRTLDKKLREADLINMAFVGTREQLAQAFDVAGWKPSESVSRHTVMRQFHAFLAKTNYETAPMSHQSFAGRPPDLTLEKTFNSYGRRDHLRVWRVERAAGDAPLWVGAAVRETGATLSFTRMGFMHHVAADLDEEQRAVERDLVGVGCIDSRGAVERRGIDKAMLNSTGEVFRTAGDVEVLRLKDCGVDRSATGAAASARFKPGSKFSRYLRKEILTVRSDLLRANCIYALFRVVVAGTSALRHQAAHRSEIKSLGLRPAATAGTQALREEPERSAPSPRATAND